ncbi:MAG: M20 family metallopeptidase [Clostridia bacterium]|nr:M20 family metallopeptidase [Clostridia bacterium]
MRRLTEAEYGALKAFKDELHAHPELSGHEYETTRRIRERLAGLGVELLGIDMPTGVIGRIRGADSSYAVALRADIDALSHRELADVEVKSSVDGVMHGCGHDFHTACLMGAATLLAAEQPPCDVLLVFQPAEEVMQGARRLIAAGLFDYPIKAMFGLHNRPEIDAGKVVVHRGPLMAAKDNFIITIKGLGGHSSMPHLCEDAIVAAAAVVSAVQTIVSRNIDPSETGVISICSIHGGTPENLPVDEVVMTGSIRSYEEDIRAELLRRLELVTENVPRGYGCRGSFRLQDYGPAVVNGERMCDIARAAAGMAMGPASVVDSRPCLASEDFALYSEHAETFFYWLGVGGENSRFAWHSPYFNTDDAALRFGAELLCASVFAYAAECACK